METGYGRWDMQGQCQFHSKAAEYSRAGGSATAFGRRQRVAVLCAAGRYSRRARSITASVFRLSCDMRVSAPLPSFSTL